MIGTTVPHRRWGSRLARAVAAILILLLAMLVSYALWAVYENTLTAAALDQCAPKNTKPSARAELSPTAARAVKAYRGEAVGADATTVDSTLTVRGLLFLRTVPDSPPHARTTGDVV